MSQTVISGNCVPKGLTRFPYLPDDARVKQPVVEGLFAISSATLWRRVRSGELPRPLRCGANTRSIAWRVGDLRAVLAQGVAA